MIARLFVALGVAFAIVACASIDPPVAFVPPEAAADPSIADGAPFERCRILPRTFPGNTSAKLYGAPGGPQAVCVTLEIAAPSAGAGAATFCVAGADLSTATKITPRDIGLDENSCAYCLDLGTNCPTSDAGITGPCPISYAPIAGKVRILRLGLDVGDEVWIDVGNVVLQRVEQRTDAGPVLQPIDCFFADGLTFQGKLVAATCTADTVECRIASSAGSRFP